jgi:phosphopantetheinyl transferase
MVSRILKFATGRRVNLLFDNIGKPYSTDLDLKFNYSHTKRLLVVSIASAPGINVGIDTEHVRRKKELDEIKSYAFSEAEQYEEDDIVTKWCIKEATVKMFGVGFRYDDPKDIIILAKDGRLDIVAPNISGSVNYFTTRLHDYIIATCTDDDEIEIIEFREDLCIS